MSLAKTLAKSEKIDARYQYSMEQWPENLPEDEITIQALFRAAARPDLEGVKIQSAIGNIFTARTSLRGLERLIKDNKVYSIECGLIPAQP
jgi:hypothetical protein